MQQEQPPAQQGEPGEVVETLRQSETKSGRVRIHSHLN